MMRLKPYSALMLALAAACDASPATRGSMPGGMQPAPIACADRHEAPHAAPETTLRTLDPDEESHSLAQGPEDSTDVPSPGLHDPHADPSLDLAAAAPDQLFFAAADTDRDCLPDFVEAGAGTDPYDPDTDGDGWFDGPCNERRHLILTRIVAHDEQEDAGRDELYLIADDVRHPHSDLDDFWRFNHGEARNFDRPLAQRTRGTNVGGPLALVRVSGWEDDFQAVNNWKVDDLLFSASIDLGAYQHGQVFSLRKTYGDWDYSLTFRVEVQRFADPNPVDAAADDDMDGISELAEWAVARDFGGISDPQRPDLLVEVDRMSGHALKTRAKRLVTTRYAMHGYNMVIKRQGTVPLDGCLTLGEARNLYRTRFDYQRYDAFRYAVIGERLWNDASGVAIGDTFLVDDSTWWINGGVLPLAATFIHEVGHTVGLTQSTFRLIDTVGWLSYDSAMNYTYQATKVDYSDSGAGGRTNDHDDWAVVDLSRGLRYRFGSGDGDKVGVCD